MKKLLLLWMGLVLLLAACAGSDETIDDGDGDSTQFSGPAFIYFYTDG